MPHYKFVPDQPDRRSDIFLLCCFKKRRKKGVRKHLGTQALSINKQNKKGGGKRGSREGESSVYHQIPRFAEALAHYVSSLGSQGFNSSLPAKFPVAPDAFSSCVLPYPILLPSLSFALCLEAEAENKVCTAYVRTRAGAWAHLKRPSAGTKGRRRRKPLRGSWMIRVSAREENSPRVSRAFSRLFPIICMCTAKECASCGGGESHAGPPRRRRDPRKWIRPAEDAPAGGRLYLLRGVLPAPSLSVRSARRLMRELPLFHFAYRRLPNAYMLLAASAPFLLKTFSFISFFSELNVMKCVLLEKKRRWKNFSLYYHAETIWTA